jgi:hypothetical protein
MCCENFSVKGTMEMIFSAIKCSYSPCFVCAVIFCQKLCHSSYSPHLALCDFLSFTELQLLLKEQIFDITAIEDTIADGAEFKTLDEH